MVLVSKSKNGWEKLSPSLPVTFNDISASWDTVSSWSVADREAFGVFTMPEIIIPDGKSIVSYEIGGEDRPEWIVIYEDAPPPRTPRAPDGPSLRLWRTALKLWRVGDTTRFASVDAAITALEASTDPQRKVLGTVAREAFEYANTVDRETLSTMMGAFGFTEEDVEESLWRADRVLLGDYSGVWPLRIF